MQHKFIHFVPYMTSIFSHGLHKELGKSKRKIDHLCQREMPINNRCVYGMGSGCNRRIICLLTFFLACQKVTGNNSWQIEPEGNTMAYLQELNKQQKWD